MSRHAIAAVLGVYFLAALAFGFLLEFAVPLESGRHVTAIVAGALETAIAAYVISGIAPVGYWALSRFRPERAAGSLFAWGALGIAVMIFSGLATFWHQKAEISRASANITNLTGSVQDTFIRSVSTGCVSNQKKQETSGKRDVSDEQIESFCKCFADRMVKEVTAEEIMDIARDGRPPQSFQDKANRIAPACSQLILGR